MFILKQNFGTHLLTNRGIIAGLKITCLYVITFLIFMGIPACDAPRNNPFDPNNEDSPFVILEGKITSTLDGEPLNDVKLTFLPYNIATYSDEAGTFAFDYFERADGWMKLEKQGFFSDSVFIEWGNLKKKSVNAGLGYKPKLSNFIYYSVVQNRTNPESLDYILVKTKIIELGNVIDSVFLRYSGQYIKTMGFNISTKYFETTFSADDMDLKSIDETIGKQIELVITNNRGIQTIAGILNIQRVIRTEIVPESPSSGEEIYLPITFKWNKYSPGFQHSYLIQIFTNEIEPELVSQKAFSGSNESYSFGSYVSPGEFFWVLWSIDEFGNRNRSKPLSFTLK